MREKSIENKLCKAVKNRGGMLMPGGVMAFVETKATGETMRKLQKRRKKQLEALGFKVYCLNDEMKVEEIINGIQTV